MSAPTCLDCQVLPPFSIVLCPLHAAAPAMLAALEGAAKWFSEPESPRRWEMAVHLLDSARAAIAKAKGEGR